MYVMPPVFNSGDTIYFPFDTYAGSTGASVTISGLSVTDIEVYKNGSTIQRASDNGYALLDTDGIDFDGSTGLHGFSIDTSDTSDSGFWADGAQYWVHVNAITVDGQTVRFTYYLTLGYLLRPTTAGRKLDVSSGGEAGLDWANVGSPTTTVNLSGTTVKTATDIATLIGTPSETATVCGDINSIATTANNILDDTATDGVVVNSLTIAGQAAIQSEVNDALVANNLDHLLLSAVDTNFATTVHLNSVIGHLADNGTSATFDRTTDSQEAIRDRGDAAWTTATGFSTHTAADVWAVATRVLTAGTNIALAKGTGVTGFNDLSASDVRTAVGLATANLDTQLAAIVADTNELQTDWANGGRLDLLVDAIVDDTGTSGVVVATFTTAGKAELQTEANDAIVANRLDELLAADSDIDGAQPPAVGSVFHETLTKTAGSFTYDQTTDSLEAIRDRGDAAWTGGGGGGLGTGARTVTITVDDGTDPLESARVRVIKGAEDYVGSTDVDGEIVFNLDDGTWAVAISLAGYSFAGASLVVNATTAETYSLTAHTLTPSDPSRTTGWLIAYDDEGEPEAGVTIYCSASKPGEVAGGAHTSEPRSAVSDVDGIAEFPNLFPGFRYRFWRGTSTERVSVTIPSDAGATYELPSIIGAP